MKPHFTPHWLSAPKKPTFSTWKLSYSSNFPYSRHSDSVSLISLLLRGYKLTAGFHTAYQQVRTAILDQELLCIVENVSFQK